MELVGAGLDVDTACGGNHPPSEGIARGTFQMRVLKSIPLVIGLLLIMVGSIRLEAQTRNRLDNRGKEFWLAFLQTNGAEVTPRLGLTLSAERAGTTIRITYVLTNTVYTITLPQANTAYHYDLLTQDLLLPDPRRGGEITSSSLKVESDYEITVYGVNMMIWSSDSFVGLPTDVLGTRHIILSYPNTIAADLQGEFTGASDFPSQFAVVATRNGTTVDVSPTARINGRLDNSPFRVTLDAGEVFFAQADGKAGVDLTGTQIRTSQPVTVFGSHQRTNIPWTLAVGRDHLVEQLPSVDHWGSRTIVTPHYQIRKTKADPNIYRVLAANDNTVISIDSTVAGTLNSGQMMELPLTSPHLIEGSGPILIAQYQASSSDNPYVRIPNDSIGDPFMALVQAPEQFDTLYAFESYSSPDFFFHFVNVTIPTERVNTLLLDNGPVNAPFTRIAKTSYSFAQIPVTAGTHVIRAGVPFGLMIYGVGPYNSYGHPGAFVFDTLYKDQRRPDINWRDTCGGAAGAAIDDKFGDRGMDTLRLRETSRNVGLALDQYRRGDDSIHFHLNLVDPYQDGWADLVAVDSVGLDRYYSFPVKGFTLSVSGASGELVQLDTLASLNDKEFCRKITVRNYGSFPQDLTTLISKPASSDIQFSGVLPTTLQPGEFRTFEVCYKHVGDTAQLFTISIGNDCRLRDVASLPVISGVDSTRPVVTPGNDPCRQDESVTLSDIGILNSGIDSVIVVQLVNADTIITPGLPSQQASIVIRRQDPYKDMVYSLIVKDAVGNESRIADTIAGFTLAVTRPTGEQLGVRFDAPWDFASLTYGELSCDTVYLHNYGLFPLDLTSLHLEGNAQFSIPPEQLPIHLDTGQTRALAVCVTPRSIGDHVDTLVAEFFCGAVVEQIPVHTTVQPLYQSSKDGCGSTITFNVGGFLRRSFLETPVPNPVVGPTASITVGLAESGPVSLSIYDGKGIEVRRVLDESAAPAGLAQVDTDVSDLPTGVYFVRLRTAKGDWLTEKLVINH